MTADLSKYTDLHIFAQAFPSVSSRWGWQNNC
jgi:transketolase C-terminal domain/subunit